MAALILLAYFIAGIAGLIVLGVSLYAFATWKEFARDIEDGSP